MSVKYALLLCFGAFLHLDSVNGLDFKGYNRIKPNNFKDKIGNNWNSENGFENVKNRKEVKRDYITNKANDCYEKFKIDRDFKQCKKDVDKSWKKVNNSERIECCLYYYRSDCAISSAKRLCDSSGFEEIYRIVNREITDQEKDCPNYGYKSFECHLKIARNSCSILSYSLQSLMFYIFNLLKILCES